MTENEYQVMLELRDGARVVSGFFVYRGDGFPKVDDVIAIEPVTDPRADWFDYPSSGCARVTHVSFGHRFPIHAMEIESES